MARPSLGNGIGRALTREERALIEAEVALAERDFALSDFRRPSTGKGIVAVGIDGRKTLMHLGRDKADALFGLASLARRPAGRGGW